MATVPTMPVLAPANRRMWSTSMRSSSSVGARDADDAEMPRGMIEEFSRNRGQRSTAVVHVESAVAPSARQLQQGGHGASLFRFLDKLVPIEICASQRREDLPGWTRRES